LLFSTHGLRLQYRTGDGAREGRGAPRHLPWLPRGDLRRWQLEAVNALLAHARDFVPFYRDRLPGGPLRTLGELSLIPPFGREEAIAADTQLYSRATAGMRLLRLTTGGTTGPRLEVRCTSAAVHRHYAAFSRFRDWIGIGGDARVAVFVGSHTFPAANRSRGAWMADAGALVCASDMLGSESLAAYVERLVAFAPSVIDSYPSSIEAIARFMRWRGDDRLRPATIITSAEPLTPSARRVIEETFGCPVFDHYGHAEMAAFITQCRAGSYHINADYGVVELLRDGVPAQPGEAGEIVATGFVNYAMPLIRYATGDWAIAGRPTCACGRTFPTVGRIIGRRADIVTTRTGELLLHLDPAFKRAPEFLETRIVQDAPDHLVVEAVTNGALDPLQATTLLGDLRAQVGPSVRADLRCVPRLPRTPSGKMRAVIRTDPHPGFGART
jgi:phenylacetate-CoA ligase